jgi:hypothetical protein
VGEFHPTPGQFDPASHFLSTYLVAPQPSGSEEKHGTISSLLQFVRKAHISAFPCFSGW